MKKLIALLLALVMLLSLAACGGESTENNEEKQTQGASNEKEEIKEEKSEISFSGMTVVDNDECKIEITEIDPNNMWGYTLKVQLENKSADKTYVFSVNDAAINGVQSSPFFASTVAPGKKANEEIQFSDVELEENGIGDFTDIELSFRVYDDNDWLADEVALETVNVYPYGAEKAKKFVRESQPDDNVLVDNEYATIIVTGYEDDDIWGYTVNLFLVNKTDKEVMFAVDDASVNGFMLDPFFATSVTPGKCAFASMSWGDSSFEENGITDVEEIEFLLRAYDYDNIFDDDLINETITLNP